MIIMGCNIVQYIRIPTLIFVVLNNVTERISSFRGYRTKISVALRWALSAPIIDTNYSTTLEIIREESYLLQ